MSRRIWIGIVGLALLLVSVGTFAQAPTLTETQKLRAELVVSKLQRVDAQLTALQAQLALVAGERDRLQAEARVLEPELIKALGGEAGKDRLDWTTLQLVKAAPPDPH